MSEKTTRIRRAKHDSQNHYFALSRLTAQQKELSYEALGMLAYLLSKSDDWEVQPKDLQRKGCGRDKVYRILTELKDARYIQAEAQSRDSGKYGDLEYLVYEQPYTEKPDTANTDTVEGKPPHTDSPYPANPDSTEYRVLESTESNTRTELKDSLPDGKTSVPIPDGNPLPIPIEEESHPAVAPGWLGWGRPVDMSTLDLIPGDQYVEPPRQPYDCTEIDIAEMIAAWWEWVPVKPGLRGKPSKLADHMKVPTNREYARNLFERGVRPADFVKCLVEIKYSRDENDNPHRLAGKEMTFQYVCPIVDQWVAANRPDEMGLYTVAEPRFVARKPGMKYQIGEDIYARAKEFFIDTAPAYIPVAALTDPENADDNFSDTTDETDYEKWTPEEWARNGMPL